MAETVALTMGELDRLQVMSQLAERRLTRRGAAALLGLSERQVRRLYRAFRRDGATALASRHRGRPSNRQLATATREQALTLVRERYVDFGPTFAHQKLTEQHGLAFSVETLRGWMTAVGLWVPRAQRLRRSQPPRPRRACLGELVQIDGSEHAWFEDRGPVCTLLVYVDDATSRLMELAFAAVESTFDYFRATRRYLGAPRKADGLLQRSTQRLSCPRPRARSERPWALTIRARPAGAQHRPPLRTQSRSQGAGRTGQRHLAGPARQRAAVARPPRSRPAAPFLPEFMADYNRRFAKPPAVAYDAHRPLRPGDDLTQLFTLQETRRIGRQLTVHYKRDLYVLDDTVATRRRRGATVVVSEAEDGTVTMRINGRVLAARLYPKDHAQLDPGVVVEHKHLDGVFAFIAAQQQQRDAARLASPKLTRREKDRLHAGSALRAPALSPG